MKVKRVYFAKQNAIYEFSKISKISDLSKKINYIKQAENIGGRHDYINKCIEKI